MRRRRTNGCRPDGIAQRGGVKRIAGEDDGIMPSREDLNQYTEAYSGSPFQEEYERALRRYLHFCRTRKISAQNYLELGIGHGITLDGLRRDFERVLVLEGASAMVRKYAGRYPNVEIVETYFEDFATEEKFDHIGVCAVLEHVDDPVAILRKYAGFLTPNGRMFIGVPSASSMHRLLAQRAGLLADPRNLSEIDLAFGHKRSCTYEDWLAIVGQAGLRIEKTAGLALKPFALSQLTALNLTAAVKDALDEFAENYPELANGLFIEARAGRPPEPHNDQPAV